MKFKKHFNRNRGILILIGIVFFLMILLAISILYNEGIFDIIGQVVYSSGSDDYSGSSGSGSDNYIGGSDNYIGGSDNYVNDTLLNNCTTGWTCENWSACTNNRQTRICVNLNGCSAGKPSEFQSCISVCDSNWQCGDWGVCVGYQQKRTCSDLNNCYGNSGTQEESQLCSKELIGKTGSSSGGGEGESWECMAWGECNADYGLTDLVGGNVAFRGFMKKKCTNSITGEVIEEKKICETRSKITITEKEECNINSLQILDEKQELVSKMNLDRVSNKLNMQFVLGNATYCSYCYDRVKNYDEIDIDCGGKCPSCEKNLRKYPGLWKALLFYEWIVILIIVILITWYVLRDDKLKNTIKTKKK